MENRPRTIAGRPANETLQREVYGAFGDSGATIEALRLEIDRAKNLGLKTVDFAPGLEFQLQDVERAIKFIMELKRIKLMLKSHEEYSVELAKNLKILFHSLDNLMKKSPLEQKFIMHF